ncbi:MAG TPA: beta-galactosidase [Puia sp.]
MKQFSIILFVLASLRAAPQIIYPLDASHVDTVAPSGHFKMGHAGPRGKELLVNSRYLTIGGVPQIPVMGELQYSRMPRERWEDEILKMKAAGVNIIATYSFWNHHEEVEGSFDWNGNKDLRGFIKLCARLGVLVYPRIGPWSHGEARNGGTPDWILRKRFITDRSMDPVYQSYVDRYFHQIGLQLQGLIYKDGGPIVGIQLENEYWKGPAGEPYIRWLKNTALRYGMDVPLYTVTGWGNGSVPDGEVIPLWGGYPDESWDPNIEKITGCDNYTFQPFRDDSTIGNAQVKKKEGYDYSQDPYFTCEMGLGIFSSTHRRPVIGVLDGPGLVVSRIGSGGNLLGYYIFAGGSNPLGLYSTMEENKDETGYWSELSPISYDFQAAIRENGLPAPVYHEVRRLNYFLNEFGHLLAPMEPVFPQKKEPAGLQYAARVKGGSGFLFGINYCRNSRRSVIKAQFRLRLKEETLTFPSAPADIPDSSLFIWPVNLDMDGVRLIYATAQPLFHTKVKGQSIWVFTQDVSLLPECCLDGEGIERVDAPNGNVSKAGGRYIISKIHPGSERVITITKKDGTVSKLLFLSREEGRQAWILDGSFFLSSSNLYCKGRQLYITDTINSLTARMMVNHSDSFFITLHQHREAKHLTPAVKANGALGEAQWLETSVKSIDPSTLLYHKEFQKEFSADDPSKVRSAKLILAPFSECRVRINDKWVDQPIQPGQTNVLDVTGYIQKGDNILLMDFPYETGDRAFAARVLVEYFNSDRLDFSTDSSWLSSDLYYFPPVYGSKDVYPITWSAPRTAQANSLRAAAARISLPGFRSWTLTVPCDYREGLNNVYMAVKYQGDRISVRWNHRLIADNLNNNTDWLMDLRRGDDQLECQDLQLEIRPWTWTAKMYFDKAPAPADEGKCYLESLRLVPEYQAIMSIPD